MKNLINFTALAFALIFLVGHTSSQESASLSIDESKRLIEKFNSELIGVDKEIDKRIELEINRQVSIAPKDEFESSSQYVARISKAATLRKQLEIRYEPERKSRKAEIKQKIDKILEMEFTKPVKLVLQTYDADKEYFPVSLEDSEGKSYEDFLNIPRDEARILKETISSANVVGLYGISIESGRVSDYYFSFKMKIVNKIYSSIPPVLDLNQKQLLQYYSVYSERHVVYLRKVINMYLKDRNSIGKYEREVLDGIDEKYLRSRFIVWSIDPFLAGGQYIKIIFIDHPDAIFVAWVYRILEVRSFEKEETDEREMRLNRIRYKAFLADRIHSL